MANLTFKRVVASVAALALYTATANATGVAVTATRPQNTYQSGTLNPTGTTSTAAPKMMGLAGAFTPSNSGQVMVIITGDLTNATAGDGAIVQIAYGTGGAPANAATATGTTVGSPLHYIASPTTTDKVLFTAVGFATLTAGTAYWIDAQLEAVTGGTATISDVVIIVHEL